MKLDRNNTDHKHSGKYALVKLRKVRAGTGRPFEEAEIARALETLERAGVLDYGDTPATEFFVIRLKDVCAEHALISYACKAKTFDDEYANEIVDLAMRSGRNHPLCKTPD